MPSMTRFIFQIFASFIAHGSVQIRFADDNPAQEPLVAKGRQSGPDITLLLDDKALLTKLTFSPELAFPEAYMDERLVLIDTTLDDFMIFLFLNKQQFATRRIGKLTFAFRELKSLCASAIKRREARANVAHHYDLTDELYDTFLDERRQYSCAYFRNKDTSLEEAQRHKIARLGAKLRLKEHSRILDIGCGWGELAYGLSSLEKGCHVHGITLSENQYDYATRHVATRQDKPAITFALQDYRDEYNLYDHIVSVGMLEHVGAKSFDTYFTMVDRCLSEDGTAVIHTIGKRKACCSTSPFITKYIFPGGYIPTLADLTAAIAKTDLHIADVECMHNHYADTLLAWRKRCEAQKENLIALYDERFYRMWLFYLVACEYFFRLDEGVVYQIQLIKKRTDAPSTRDYIAQAEQTYVTKLCQQKSPFGKPPP